MVQAWFDGHPVSWWTIVICVMSLMHLMQIQYTKVRLGIQTIRKEEGL